MKEIRIFAYTMKYDTGFAPAVHNKVLSLGCCKTLLRHKIAKEWNMDKETTDFFLMGICGKQLADRNRKTNQEVPEYYFPIYIAKVKEAVKAIDYYKDQLDSERVDTQYSYCAGKWLYSIKNPHHTNTNGDPSNHTGWLFLPDPENNKDINYINRKTRDENYILLSDEYMCPRSPKLLHEVPCIRKICEERSLAWRCDLSPIKSLDTPELIHEFLDFFEQHKNDPKYNNDKTIDEFFIKKTCRGEIHCQ